MIRKTFFGLVSTNGLGRLTPTLMNRHSGVCKSWIASKGYGFISQKDVDKDIFVHYTSLTCTKPRKMMSVGEECEFDIEDNEGKKRAINVTASDGNPLMGGDLDPSMIPRAKEGRTKTNFYHLK